jgi:hypothetical protein
MSKLNGRKPVEIKLPDLLNNHIPIYDSQNRLWNTIDAADIISSSVQLSGSNTFHGDQIISGNLIVTGSVSASFFTGSFVGDGSHLVNIPISGVTGLYTDRITDGSATASISSTKGLRINTNTEITGSLFVASGSATFDATLALTENSSLILNSGSNLYVYDGGIISGTFKGNGSQLTDLTYATTGSNTFYGSQVISGSVIIRENLTVLGSSSITYVTASQLEVLNNNIFLNAYSPAFRFAGISVYDSGSVGLTGSLYWDSENNVWLYQNPNNGGLDYVSARLISGPKNTGSLGNEVGITVNKIQKAVGDDHIGDSNITELLLQ